MATNRTRALRAPLLVALLLAATHAVAGAAPKCPLPDVSGIEAKLDTLAVPKGTMPARQRQRYYNISNWGALVIGYLLTPDAARKLIRSSFEAQAVAGLDPKVHLGCGTVYTYGRGPCPILRVTYDVRSRRITEAECDTYEGIGSIE